MLILTRKRGESIYIGPDIKVTVVELKGNQVRVGIDAPKDQRVYREEIYLQILEENRHAAEAARATSESIENLSEAWEGKMLDMHEEESELLKAPRPRLSSVSRASVGGQEIPVFKRRKKDTGPDER